MDDGKIVDLRERVANKEQTAEPVIAEDQLLYRFFLNDGTEMEIFGRLVVTPVFIVVTAGDNLVVFATLFDKLNYVVAEGADENDPLVEEPEGVPGD